MFVAEGWRLHKCCVTHIIDLIKAVSFVSSDVMVAKKAALVGSHKHTGGGALGEGL